MKALLIGILAAAASQAALAQSGTSTGWEAGPLDGSWSINQIMEAPVFATDDSRVGAIHDVILNPTGLIDSIVVEQRAPDKAGLRYFRVDWSKTDFDPVSGQVDLQMTEKQVSALHKQTYPRFREVEQFEVSDLLGMPVSLDDARPFGEVVDLRISPNMNDVQAFIVQSDGIGEKQYALRANFRAIDRGERHLYVSGTVAEIEQLGLFNTD